MAKIQDEGVELYVVYNHATGRFLVSETAYVGEYGFESIKEATAAASGAETGPFIIFKAIKALTPPTNIKLKEISIEEVVNSDD